LRVEKVCGQGKEGIRKKSLNERRPDQTDPCGAGWLTKGKRTKGGSEEGRKHEEKNVN